MTTPGWQASVGQWGDQLWALALVGTGDRVGAQHALVQVFARVFGAATPPTDPRTALLQALVPRRHRWVPRVTRQRALPRALRRINRADRVLLALWLAHEHDGAQLARVAQVPQSTLVPRIVAVLLPFLPRRDIARRTPAGRTTFAQWVGHQLGSGAAPLPDTFPQDTIMGWQQAVERVRDLITAATQQRLPASCRDAIETTLTARADETPAWQRRAGWVALALLVLAIGWIWRPTAPATTAPTTTVPPPADARAVVQAAIDGWTTMPISGTLHRRVWALDTRPGARNPALVTDVWLSSEGAQYRVETTHDGTLAEWHVVDRSGTLHTAANKVYNMCHWAYGPSVPTERRTQVFDVPSADVRAVRDARLRSGTYGEGYRMLRRALHAPDLRSYGVRTDNERVLLTLGFRDTTTTPTRTILVVIDARTNELQTVRELAGDAAQTTARELWRLDAHEMVATVPTALPPWAGPPQRRAEVFDPACPDLQRSNVFSVRAIAATSGPEPAREWGAKYVPTPLPSHVTQAAFFAPASDDPNGEHDPSFAELVLRSADGWLHVRPNFDNSPVPAADDLRRGVWTVRFNDVNGANDSLTAILWRQSDDPLGYTPVFDVEAVGWTRDQLVDMVARLQPVNARTWPTLAPRFLDPQPLPAAVERVVVDAQQALAALPDGTYQVTMDATARTGPPQDDGSAPADVPFSITAPHAWTVEQWATISDSVPVRFKQVATAADGTLVGAIVDAAGYSGWYDARTHATDSSANTGESPYAYVTPTFGIDLVRPLLEWDAPITMTADDEVWRFEQVLPLGGEGYSSKAMVLQNPAWDMLGASLAQEDDLPRGDLVQRVSVDRAHFLPRRWDVVRRSPGDDIVLLSITVRAWRMLDASLPDEFWVLPPLPSATMLN